MQIFEPMGVILIQSSTGGVWGREAGQLGVCLEGYTKFQPLLSLVLPGYHEVSILSPTSIHHDLLPHHRPEQPHAQPHTEPPNLKSKQTFPSASQHSQECCPHGNRMGHLPSVCEGKLEKTVS